MGELHTLLVSEMFVPLTLSAAQRETYDREGLLYIPHGLEAADALAMAEVLWRALGWKYRMDRHVPSTWTVRRPSGLAPALQPDAFAAMASPTVVGALDALLGAGWTHPARWGVPLVSFPDPDVVWAVPHQQWHLDSPATPLDPTIARVFVVLAPLAPRGGGTVVVTGSHKIVQRLALRAGTRLRSSEAKRMLWAEQPWFADLASPSDIAGRTQRFMIEGAEIDGVPVRVVEMVGQPGDVYFMHPCLLHAASSNVQATPRLMLTQWIEGGASL